MQLVCLALTTGLLTPNSPPTPRAYDVHAFRQRLELFAPRTAPQRKPAVATVSTSLQASDSEASAKQKILSRSTFDRLLRASELLDDAERIVLSAEDIELALCDMHLQRSQTAPPGIAHPSTFLPAAVYAAQSVDVTELVRETLPRIFEEYPVFTFMADEMLGNDDFYRSVYFGTASEPPSSPSRLSFADLCRRLVASIYVFELLVAMGRDEHRQLATWYEAKLRAARAAAPVPASAGTRSPRDALMGFFLAIKGESVLASINAFEMLRRVSEERRGPEEETPAADTVADTAADADDRAFEVAALSRVLNAIMGLNIFEAVISNLSFAYWPDNARAGMALLLHDNGSFSADGTQDLSADWMRLYLGWNANFVWPSHYCADMMAFTMLVTPSIALGDPAHFQYRRAHTLFWVARSTQLTRLARGPLPHRPEDIPCFRCKQLEPSDDRQPLTSRTARLTRAAGERLAASVGEDVSAQDVWRRLLAGVPEQLRTLARLYHLMPKEGVAKLRLL